MPAVDTTSPQPQLSKSVVPNVMMALDARPGIRLAFSFGNTCDACGIHMPANGLMHFEHHHDTLPVYFLCPSCEADYRAWKEGAYCRECGALLKDGEKGHASDAVPLCAACVDKWTRCSICNKHISRGEALAAANDDLICEECRSVEYTTCGHCDQLVKSEDIVGKYDNAPLCLSCYEDGFFTCDQCERIERDDDEHSLSGERLCSSCYDERVTICDDCGRVIEHSDDVYSAGGNTVCENCLNDHYYRCDECGDMVHAHNAYIEDDSCLCDSCYSMNRIHIKRYSYKPIWHGQRLPAEACRNVLYMGVELEVDNTDSEYDNDEAAESMCAMLPAICKEDGSITNGFEIVTHPMTFGYVKSREGVFNKALAYLRSHGFSGHNHGGMHVHMGKAAFSDLHVIKFSRLFMDNVDFWTRISQRKQANLDRWANFGSSTRFDRDSVKEGKRHRNGDRYAALNFTSQTIEVRIFNSTIRTDRFYKNIEACQAAFDFSRAYGLCDMEAERYAAFVVSRRSVYPNLAAFLVEKSLYQPVRMGEAERVVKQLFNRAERLRQASGM